MKLPKLRIRNTYNPFMLTGSWVHGLITGSFVGVMLGAAKWDEKPQDVWAIVIMAALIALLATLEYLQKRRVSKLIAMVDEAQYMNGLFDNGIDVGSPNFTIAQVDADYR